MDDRSITVSCYNGLVDHSLTGHVTLSITVGGDTRAYERTIVYGVHVTPHGLTTRGVVQDAPARFTADGVPESPAAVHSNAVSRAQGQAAIDRMEELKSDTYYGIAFNNCADLVDQAFEAAGLKGYERGLGVSGKVNGPITLSVPGYIDQTLSDLNEDLRISEIDFGIPWGEAGYFDSNYQRRDFRDLPKDSSGPRCMGYDPNDPRGPWQEPGQIGDRAFGGPGSAANSYGKPVSQGGTGYVGGYTGLGPSTSSSGVSYGVGSLDYGGGDGADAGRAANPKDDPTATECRRPILLDIDGNGVRITEFNKLAQFVDGRDDLLHRTLWARAGVLFFDPDGRNAITEERQYVFTEWDPTVTGDLEAIRSILDSNGDGKLTGA